MKKLLFSTISFLLIFFVIESNAYSGPIICDGDLTKKTAKATGYLLTAFGFAYSAIGFHETEEPNKVKGKINDLRLIVRPVESAKTALEYFSRFIKNKLPSNLKSLDSTVKQTNYEKLYKKKILPKGLFVHEQIWKEVSSYGTRNGLKGLISI